MSPPLELRWVPEVERTKNPEKPSQLRFPEEVRDALGGADHSPDSTADRARLLLGRYLQAQSGIEVGAAPVVLRFRTPDDADYPWEAAAVLSAQPVTGTDMELPLALFAPGDRQGTPLARLSQHRDGASREAWVPPDRNGQPRIVVVASSDEKYGFDLDPWVSARYADPDFHVETIASAVGPDLPRLKELVRPGDGDVADLVVIIAHGEVGDDGVRRVHLAEDPATHLDADQLAEALGGARLAVVMVCRSGQRTEKEVPLHETLIEAGVGAVVSCLDGIDPDSALKFTTALYAELQAGEPIGAAVANSRAALPGPRVNWIPILTVADASVVAERVFPPVSRRRGRRVLAGAAAALALVGGLGAWSLGGATSAEPALIMAGPISVSSFSPDDGELLATVDRQAPLGQPVELGSSGDWGMIEDDPGTQDYDWSFVVRAGRSLENQWSVRLVGAETEASLQSELIEGPEPEPMVVAIRASCPPSAGDPVAWFINTSQRRSTPLTAELALGADGGACTESWLKELSAGAVIGDALFASVPNGSSRSLVALTADGPLRQQRIDGDGGNCEHGVGLAGGLLWTTGCLALSGPTEVRAYEPTTLQEVERRTLAGRAVDRAVDQLGAAVVLTDGYSTVGGGAVVHWIRPGSVQVETLESGANIRDGNSFSDGSTVFFTALEGYDAEDEQEERDRFVLRIGPNRDLAREPIRVDENDRLRTYGTDGVEGLEGVASAGALGLVAPSSHFFSQIWPAAGGSKVSRVAAVPLLASSRSDGGVISYEPSQSTLNVIDDGGSIRQMIAIPPTQAVVAARGMAAFVPSSSTTRWEPLTRLTVVDLARPWVTSTLDLNGLGLVAPDAAAQHLYTVQFLDGVDSVGNTDCRQSVSRIVADLSGEPILQPVSSDMPCVGEGNQSLQELAGFGTSSMWAVSDRSPDGQVQSTVYRLSLVTGNVEQFPADRALTGLRNLKVDENNRAFAYLPEATGGSGELIELTTGGTRTIAVLDGSTADYCVTAAYVAWVDQEHFAVRAIDGGTPLLTPVPASASGANPQVDLVCTPGGALLKGTSATALRLAPGWSSPQVVDLDVDPFSRLTAASGTSPIVVTPSGEVVALNDDGSVRFRVRR